MNHHSQFALIQTSDGAAVLAVDDISHATQITSGEVPGVRVHFKAKGGTFLDLPGITPVGLAEALNGSPF